MKHRFAAIVAAIMIMVAIAPAFAPAAAAAQNVTAWVETATTTPGVGCVVDVSVEVRSGGGAVTGADVSVAVSEDDSGQVLSMDRSTTNDSGIAWMVIDTSAGWDGAKTWMEVVVNGTYLGGQTIRITDGACSGNSSLLKMNGSVETVRASSSTSSAGSSGASASGDAVIIPNVWRYQQQRGLSCEYAALSIATGAIGGWVSEYEFESVIPLSDNPHWGYRGDITAGWGGTDNYGIYADPLVPALEHFGYSGVVFYGDGDTSQLIASIDAGHPTLVWLGMAGSDGTFDAYTSDGTRYQLTPYMHVMVAYGYDDGGIYLSDPGTGSFKYYSWGDFMWMWNAMDGMSLSVSG